MLSLIDELIFYEFPCSLHQITHAFMILVGLEESLSSNKHMFMCKKSSIKPPNMNNGQ